nr:MAG TPA: hypothetical protein [Bacteriophage sp.]
MLLVIFIIYTLLFKGKKGHNFDDKGKCVSMFIGNIRL